MKVWLGDREEEKARLLSLGVRPETILPNGDLNFLGLPFDSALRSAGLRVPTPKEARYISLLLETIGCHSSVWSRHPEGEWYTVADSSDGPRNGVIISSGRLVLIEMED